MPAQGPQDLAPSLPAYPEAQEETPPEVSEPEPYYHGYWEDEWIPSTSLAPSGEQDQGGTAPPHEGWETEWTTGGSASSSSGVPRFVPSNDPAARRDYLAQASACAARTDDDDSYEDPPWLQPTRPPQVEPPPWLQSRSAASSSDRPPQPGIPRPPGLDPPGGDDHRIRVVQLVSSPATEQCSQPSTSPKGLDPQACRVTPEEVFNASNGPPQIGVKFPSVMTAVPAEVARAAEIPIASKVVENSFTPNVEELLAELSGPLEVVHQVSPSEVRRHLDKWVEAARDELNSLMSMQAITRHRGTKARQLVQDPNIEILSAKCVFTVKPGKPGSPFRRKVRIVSCGNYAKGVSEDVLYASGAAAETLRALLVRSGRSRYSAWSTDIKNAFLLAPIPKTSTRRYGLRPPAILCLLGIAHSDEIWEVGKALYGFKEAPKWWARYRDEVLSTASFATSEGQARLQKTASDENLWQIMVSGNTVIGHVLVYVDDLLVVSKWQTAKSFHEWVKQRWQCSDLEGAGEAKALRFLGIDVYEERDDQGPCGFSLAQEGYIDELVRSHNLSRSCRSNVPVPKEWVREAPIEEVDFTDETLKAAQRITGELLWVSQRTRVDIAFGVGLMSSWTTKAPAFVTKVGLRILAYLANTRSMRLSLTPDDTDELQVFTDASFAPYGERSISGITVQLSGRCVFWKSRRQSLVSLSTAECELIAACEGVVLAQSVQALASEVSGEHLNITLRVDNTAAITLAEGGGSQRTRHLRMRASFLTEMIENGQLSVKHCPGEVQLADILTKALPAPRLEHLNGMIGIGIPELNDPSIQTVAAASRSFRSLETSPEGQGMILVLALLMSQLQPASSQEEEDNDHVDLDLYVIVVMMACSILFIWELGKHCLRQCIRQPGTEFQVAAVRSAEVEARRSRRQEAIRRAIERETGDSGVPEGTIEGAHTPSLLPSNPPASQQVTVNVSTPPTADPASSPSQQRPTWTLVRPPTPPIPDPPPPPPDTQDRGTSVRNRGTFQGSREVGVQTDGPPGLSDVQLCELEMITSSARTPGVMHLFPDCHVLRTVPNTNRRTFCRYCLMTLRQRGLR